MVNTTKLKPRILHGDICEIVPVNLRPRKDDSIKDIVAFVITAALILIASYFLFFRTPSATASDITPAPVTETVKDKTWAREKCKMLVDKEVIELCN